MAFCRTKSFAGLTHNRWTLGFPAVTTIFEKRIVPIIFSQQGRSHSSPYLTISLSAAGFNALKRDGTSPRIETKAQQGHEKQRPLPRQPELFRQSPHTARR